MYFLLVNTLIDKKVAAGIICLYLAVMNINNNDIILYSISNIVTQIIIRGC